MTELGADLGLTPVWTSELDAEYGDGGVNDAYGLSQIDVESLTAIGDAMIIYANDGSEENSATELQKNEVWQSLPAVQEDRAYAFPPNVWGAGGPARTCRRSTATSTSSRSLTATLETAPRERAARRPAPGHS